ncbi:MULTISPECIES: ISL3 family transposase [Liquorilactobacillus]|uniref:ISL3 family transposase n=6 Tax=Liquorilactobacillus TaxID=2767888 RepID=A0A3S6QS90_9LACO|nr:MULTISPECIES: ISL3 family transposase [Liquorilactobacillus]AUJ30954.1 ISL3 family transposase [Liquorilactobacillus hordei]AUJ33326.1 ISL3 family transposase [Liquorilactobacillus nagelii]MCC7617256.1 ISL3 family transposase [Liquorilactobacillus nagelii]
MSQEHSIENILQIQDPNIKCVSVDNSDPKKQVIHAKLTYPIKCCPLCGQTKVVRFGTNLINVRMPPIKERPVILKLLKQRYLCKRGQHTFSAETSLVKPHCQISEDTKQMIILQLTKDRSITDIAEELNVSPVAVNRVIDSLGVQTKTALLTLPTTLCFDEFRSTGHQMSFIAIDGDSHRLVSVLPNRLNRSIKNYFEGNYSLAERKKVKQVVIDFNAQYQSVIHIIFPEAKIIADNFHLVQMGLQALNQTRVQLMHRFTQNSREYRVLKHHWRLFLKTYSDLNQHKPQWFAHLKNWFTQEQLVWQGLELDSTFQHTYFVAHSLVDALRNRDYLKFIQTLNRADKVSPQLETTIRTYRKYLPLIKNMMANNYSNGPLEGINRKIKQIKRTAYGYKNWSHFYTRIRIEFMIKIKKRKPIRK